MSSRKDALYNDGGYSMDCNKICFIICTNNETYLEECIYYLNALKVPKGLDIDVLTIKEADSICSGYNYAMANSDALYKVYLHQDVFIINENFITNIMNIFKADEEIGMIGLLGTDTLPEDTVMWHNSERVGKLYSSNNACMVLDEYEEVLGPYKEVKALDGMLMVTKVDIPWREDIFTGWHYYDVAQSFEFIRAGYKVVVPRQETPWTIHDYGNEYDEKEFIKEQKLFIENYSTMLGTPSESLIADCYLSLKARLRYGRFLSTRAYCSTLFMDKLNLLGDVSGQDRNMSDIVPIIYMMFDMYDSDVDHNVQPLILLSDDLDTLVDIFVKLNMYLLRLQFIDDDENASEIIGFINTYKVSVYSLAYIIRTTMYNKSLVFNRLALFMYMSNMKQEAYILLQIGINMDVIDDYQLFNIIKEDLSHEC